MLDVRQPFALFIVVVAVSLPAPGRAAWAPGAALPAPADTVDAVRDETSADAAGEVPTLTPDAVLASPAPGNARLFGTEVAISGDRALVADPSQEPGGGEVYVFAYDATQPAGQRWGLEATLAVDDELSSVGGAVALDGDRALITVFPRAVLVFERSSTGWMQTAVIEPGSGAPAGSFGAPVALDGDRAIIGGSSPATLLVYSFDAAQPPGSQWRQEAELTPTDGGVIGGFGEVALDGDRVLVGSSVPGNGSAYVFAFDATQPAGQQWSQEATLTANDGAFFDQFGQSVALSGGRALVGAGFDDESFENAGTVYAFTFDGSQPLGRQWRQVAKLTDPSPRVNGMFGASLALEGSVAVIGSPVFNPDPTFLSEAPGRAFVFTSDPEGGTWTPQKQLVRSGSLGDDFGNAVALSGGRALVGAPGDFGGNPDPDAAYVFELDGSEGVTADAGPDLTVVAGQTVTLDGTGSTGEGPLGFAWALSGGPALSGADTATPSFCAAAPGEYLAELAVTDGSGSSDADAAAVTALSPLDALGALVVDVAAVADELGRGPALTLTRRLRRAQWAVFAGADPSPALDQFELLVLDLVGLLTPEEADALIAGAGAVAEAATSPCDETTGAPALAPALASAGAASELAAFPNPTAGRATVAFSVEAAGAVRLSVHDALGREVAVLAEGAVEAGAHRVELDASAWPAGVYLVRLATADGRVAAERITRLR